MSPTGSTAPDDETQDLLQFIYQCPVGLAAFDDDGTIRHVNPAAVNLLVAGLGVFELGSVFGALGDVWPELPALVADHGRPGTVVGERRVPAIGGSRMRGLSLGVTRIAATHNMLVIVDVSSEMASEAALLDGERRLRTVFDSIDDGYALCEMVVDADGTPIDYRFLETNPRFEEMTGLVDAVGRTAYELVPDLEPSWVARYAQVGIDRQTIRFEQGSAAMHRWFDVFAVPVEPDDRFAIVFKDQTVRRRADNALRRVAGEAAFRSELVDALRAATTASEARAAAARLLVDHLGAARVHHIGLDADGRYATVLDGRSERATDLGRIRLADHGPADLIDETLAGRVVVVDDVTTDARLEDLHRRATGALGVGAYVIAPSSRNGQVVAAVIVHDERARTWSPDDIRIIEEAADRTVLAIGRLDAERDLRIRHDRAELIARLLPELEQMPTAPMQLQHLVRSLVPAFADEATVEVPTAAEPVLAAAHHDTGAAAARSHLAVPLDLGRAEPGVLVLAITDPLRAPYGDNDRDFVRQAAERVGIVLVATELRRQANLIAVRLQQALLPDDVVHHPDVEIEARYQAADARMEVGGDWYDTFEWTDGRIGVMVGDVVGHNVDSAATMGRLRAATAALAPRLPSSPAAILDALDDFARSSNGTDFATAICVVIDPASRRLTYSSAGHPPAVLIGPDRRARTLPGALSTPLCWSSAAVRPETTIDLEPGSTIIMYSDGLIERRGESIDQGLERLVAVASRVAHGGDGISADRLISEMVDGASSEDDIVVTCLTFRPAGTIAG